MADRLPVPERLQPQNTKSTLLQNVRSYFYPLYNNTMDDKFRELLKSVGNDDAVTGNRLFDRHNAVEMIKAEAKKAKDLFTESAKDGAIYKCLVNIVGKHPELQLKLRRSQYKQITQQNTEPHQQAAE